jgi:hypothetical protein
LENSDLGSRSHRIENACAVSGERDIMGSDRICRQPGFDREGASAEMSRYPGLALRISRFVDLRFADTK